MFVPWNGRTASKSSWILGCGHGRVRRVGRGNAKRVPSAEPTGTPCQWSVDEGGVSAELREEETGMGRGGRGGARYGRNDRKEGKKERVRKRSAGGKKVMEERDEGMEERRRRSRLEKGRRGEGRREEKRTYVDNP